MYMIMKAEVFKNGEWHQIEDKIFKSAIEEGLMTNRVCDERNPILYEVLGAPKTCRFEHTPIATIGTYDEEKNNYVAYLDELVEYNWNAPISRIGVISEWQYKRLKHEGIAPVDVHQHIFDPDAKLVSPSEMDMILANDELRDASKYYVRYEYDTRPISSYCEFFCRDSMASIIKLMYKGAMIRYIRVVYSFVEPLTNM